jgi:hypothetical protein
VNHAAFFLRLQCNLPGAGFWFLVSGFWFLVSGFGYNPPDSRRTELLLDGRAPAAAPHDGMSTLEAVPFCIRKLPAVRSESLAAEASHVLPPIVEAILAGGAL